MSEQWKAREAVRAVDRRDLSLGEQLTNEITLAKITLALISFGLPKGKYVMVGYGETLGIGLQVDIDLKHESQPVEVRLSISGPRIEGEHKFDWGLRSKDMSSFDDGKGIKHYQINGYLKPE